MKAENTTITNIVFANSDASVENKLEKSEHEP